jgi:AraC-like DNA-binding protein
MNGSGDSQVRSCQHLWFRRYYGGPRLRRFVRDFWALQCDGLPPLDEPYRVVPDGCIDIVLARGSPTESYEGRVVGTMTRPFFEKLAGYVDYLGIRFVPGAFTAFFDGPLGELTDQIVPLACLSVPSIPVESVTASPTIQTRLRKLEDSLIGALAADRLDPTLRTILDVISAHRGRIEIAHLAEAAGWSPRHLRRMFAASVGVGPKTFCRITRFTHALRLLRCTPRPNLLRVALEAGYYDQAHFVHEFNGFYGASPAAVRKTSFFE